MNRILAFIAAGVTILGFSTVRAEGLTTQDYIDIEQLYAQYNHAIDSGDGEGWAATFTPDGAFNRFAGKDALVGFIKQWKEKMNGMNRRLEYQPEDRAQQGRRERHRQRYSISDAARREPEACDDRQHRHVQRYARQDCGRLALQDAPDEDGCDCRAAAGAGQAMIAEPFEW